MTSGVYKLEFRSGAEYVGKSINIESRYMDHLRSMRDGKASAKMMKEYKEWGEPTLTTLIEAHPDHIDILETYIIGADKPSLNTMIPLGISEEAFDLLIKHRHYLQYPTSVLVNLLVNQAEEEEQSDLREIDLQRELDAAVDKYTHAVYASEAGELLKDSERIITELRSKLADLTADLDAELSKPWWSRIFK